MDKKFTQSSQVMTYEHTSLTSNVCSSGWGRDDIFQDRDPLVLVVCTLCFEGKHTFRGRQRELQPVVAAVTTADVADAEAGVSVTDVHLSLGKGALKHKGR